MKKIAYLLHRFPGITDTFVKREIQSLQRMGTSLQIISVWKPNATETTQQIMRDWPGVHFLLPQSVFSIFYCLFRSAFRSPSLFAATAHLAISTSKVGFRGFIYQVIYFIEAILAADVMRHLRIDHVHNHFGDHSGIITMLAGKLTRIPYSLTFHGPHVFYDGFNGAMKEKVANAQFIRCIGYYCRSQVIVFSQSMNISAMKIVRCGLNLENYQYNVPRAELKQIFCAARLAPEKGLVFLIEALATLVSKGHDLELTLAGDGPGKPDLEHTAARLGVTDKVTFLGSVSEQKINDELLLSDLFVLPSLAEGIPVSLMEAMATGVPVIAANIAGVSELIEDGINGLLVRPSDAGAIADAVIRMIDDYDFRCTASKHGRQKVTNEFDIDKEAAKLNGHFMQF